MAPKKLVAPISLLLFALSHTVLLNAADFYSDFTVTWGGGRATIYNGGEDLQLMMDRASGSGGESKTAFLFGRFDVQIKLIPGNSAGTVTTFYLQSRSPYQDEIDFEFLGSNSSYVLHTNIYTGGNGGREQQFHFWFDPTADFHTYSILWNPQQINWYVDGIPIRVFKKANVSEVAYLENQPMKIHASLWDGSNWIGPIDWSKAPFIAHYHGYSYTACVWTGSENRYGLVTCSNNGTGNNWMNKVLSEDEKNKIEMVQKKYMFYTYCNKSTGGNRSESTIIECSINT
ncbi:xyloglucan endotransglucosylase/hydrolase protein 24-like [Ananas comosus]|uniref:Xyloglucan endotransglucosylase/hydrolase protein 24-like n=1 Tax=Ananas comosus TaxID=4615 RepID=A0A6P5G078_ANACO|nr:xyloglucan endotransglucosylase/hydrolase protein 24-like [Ananas comosus]